MPRRPLPFVRHRTANQIRSKYRAWRHPIKKSYWATIAYGSLVFVGDIGNPPAGLSYNSGGTSQSSRSRFCTSVNGDNSVCVRCLRSEPNSAPVVHLHHFAGRGAKHVRRAGRPWRKRTRVTPNQKRRNLVALMVMILAIFPFLADFWCCGDCRVQLGYPLPMKSQQLALAPRKGGPLANLPWEKTP